MPTFLGSSFAFISALCGVIGNSSFGATKDEQISAAMAVSLLREPFILVLSLIIKIFGKGLIDHLFPPVVRGVGITLIGLNLALLQSAIFRLSMGRTAERWLFSGKAMI